MASPPTDIDHFLSTEFTHLVIGGGTAGLVVATRLAEREDIVVGILEAGLPAYDEPGINVPGRFCETLGTEYDWQFATVPQPGFNGRALPWPRGKVLGGSAALNIMTWNRACKEDYDAWEELGNEGWGWEGMLQFGTSHQYWHKTLNKLGVETNRSHFSGSNVGAWTTVTSVEPNRRGRSYSTNAYYQPNAHKSNLKLLSGATVQEVLLDPSEDGWVAKGVRFTYQGKEHSVYTKGEVIICAGSVQSPQLLELSGIGNPEVLEAAGIDVKIDNPAVGENLQDHMMTCTVWEIDPSIPTIESLRSDPVAAAAADLEYDTSRTGLRTCLPASVAYLPFSHFLNPDDIAETGRSLACSSLAASMTLSSPSTLSRPSSPQSSYPSSPSTPSSPSAPSSPSTPSSPASSISYTSTTASSATKSQMPLPHNTKPPEAATRASICLRRLTHPQNLGQIEYNFDLSNYSPYFVSEPGKRYATMLMMLQYPFSTGSIHLPPTNTNATTNKRATADDKPLINPRYFLGAGGENDLEMMSAGQKFADKIVRTAPLSDIIVKRAWPPERRPFPRSPQKTPSSTQESPSSIHEEEEEEDFTPWIRSNTTTDWHPIGTCSMGPSPFPQSPNSPSPINPHHPAPSSTGYVVDSRLRVHGTRNLRIIDASVMPLQISAHLQATVYAIGEKGAGIVGEEWGARSHRCP
ncbi:MAG: hypothetical protein L6R37_005137 [Teloschistes peruensis]|nr:MAG: hypothetical protein L6R37_005137 [Teloschistes peruensis]